MSNAWLAKFQTVADRAFKRVGLADDATYKQTANSTPVACVVYLTRDIQQIGAESQVADNITTLRVASTLPRPTSASKFTVGSEVFQVDRVDASDEGEHLCIVRKL